MTSGRLEPVQTSAGRATNAAAAFGPGADPQRREEGDHSLYPRTTERQPVAARALCDDLRDLPGCGSWLLPRLGLGEELAQIIALATLTWLATRSLPAALLTVVPACAGSVTLLNAIIG